MSTTTTPNGPPEPALPRITIQFCTQCKWMLRAAYYAQELLSTFSLSLGEVALQPSTGGTFVVAIQHRPQQPAGAVVATSTATTTTNKVLWDRRVDGGFPETKELKRRVRDVVEPARDLGHVDRQHHPGEPARDGATTTGSGEEGNPEVKGVSGTGGGGDNCEDCAP
ncbi:rdx family protein [Hirsutella rhossiliensis]|uniref:Rdx family domain-containing protein n=1 Tax=Hirsutella rhossiliensis TaxID=111463 RepID=A0A9P8N525_9HYPO|nr:rdx family domain-containing protein [Hirsutella rhossiliensis]KAH0966757.1 rdx family domain-containing protein [Hirsutella rhossiliensis]